MGYTKKFPGVARQRKICALAALQPDYRAPPVHYLLPRVHAEVLAFVREHPGCTYTEISEAVGVSRKTLGNYVSLFERYGLVQREPLKVKGAADQMTVTLEPGVTLHTEVHTVGRPFAKGAGA